MKKFRILLMLLLVAVVLAPGCKDDDDDTTPSSQMTIADTSYEMSQAVLENYGQHSGAGYNFDLILLSQGFVLHEVNGELDSVSGVGNGLSFEIFTATEDMLDAGEYLYDGEGTEAPGTFDEGVAVVDFNTITEDGNYYDITNGKLTVEKSDNTYTFTFEGTDSHNVTITAYYKGVPKIYDYSDEMKSAKVSHRIFW
jgi:hypothetical protein